MLSQTHQLREHLGARNHRICPPRGSALGFARTAVNHDDIGVADVRWACPTAIRRPAPQTIRRRGSLLVTR